MSLWYKWTINQYCFLIYQMVKTVYTQDISHTFKMNELKSIKTFGTSNYWQIDFLFNSLFRVTTETLTTETHKISALLALCDLNPLKYHHKGRKGFSCHNILLIISYAIRPRYIPTFFSKLKFIDICTHQTQHVRLGGSSLFWLALSQEQWIWAHRTAIKGLE